MKNIARNIFLSMSNFAFPIILALVATPIIFRGLGAISYGIWALVGNVVGYMTVFNSLQTAGTKYLAEYIALNDHDNIRNLIGTSLIYNLLIGVIVGGSILVFAKTLATAIFKIPIEFQSQGIIAFRLAGIGFFFSTIGWWGTAILVGIQRFDWLMGISLATNTFFTLGSIFAIQQGWGVIGVVMANVTGSILSSILYIWSVRALLSAASRLFIFNWAMFKRIFSYGIYSTLQVIFGILMSQLDRTLLGIWIGVAAVTTYTIPLSVANRIQQLCAKSLEIVFPLSSGLNAQSRTDQLKHLFLRAQNLNVVLVLMSSIPLIILAPEILKFWISPEFAIETALVFRLLVVAYALLGLIVVPAGMVAGFGHPEVNAGFGVLVGLSNLLGYFLFIPSWGVNGAGIASLFGSLIAVPVFLWYINYRFLKVSLSEIFTAIIVRQALSSIIMAGGLFLIRPFIINPLVLLLALGGSCIIFLVMTVLFGVWQAQELELLRLKWLRVSGG